MLLALAPLLVSPQGLQGQSTVTLQGRVTTEAAQPLPGAQIAVRNVETGNQRGTITSANGSYTIVGLSPGSYEVSAQMLGYGSERRDVRLLVGQRVTLDFQLTQGAIEVTGIEVVAEREQTFEVQRTDVSSPVVQAEIANLPLNTRNTMNLAAIVPGIKTFAPTAGRSLPAAGSLPDLRFWNFYLDGVEWKSMFNGNLVGIPQTGSPIPQEAVREFRVHLNPYDAEFTRGASYIISAVTHRGTNETEGNGFFYFQNNSLTELDHFQAQRAANNADFERADYERQQLGFNLRGPVMRDKLFYSVSYELNNTTNAIEVVPGRPGFNPDIWSQQAGTFSAPTKNHTGVVRLTAPVGDNHTLDGIYSGRYYDSETSFGGRRTRDAGISANYAIHSLQLRDQFTPTPSLLNELSFHLLRWNHNESPLVAGPELIYPSLQLTGRSGFPLELEETHLRLINKLTYSVPGGRHLINGGVELSRIRTDSYLPNNRNGSFEFRTDTSSLPFRANIAVGFFDPNSTEDARAVTDGWITGLFIQDQWQATNTLTLNLGLRYDAEINTLNNDFTVPWADHPVLEREIPEFLNEGDRENDLNNVAPRFSFSWDVFGNQQTFLRGGTGIMYDRVATFMAFFEKRSAGWRTYEFRDPGTLDADVLRQRVIQGGGTATAPSINLMKDRMDTPMNYQFSLGVGHELATNLALNLDFITQRAKNLYVLFNANPVIPGRGRALTSDFGNIILYDDIGEAQFQALAGQLTYDRRTDETLPIRLNAAYTLGWYESQFDGLGGYSSRAFLDMQPTTGDERHRLVLSGLGPLPYGFQLSGVAIFATPTPFGVTVGQDLNQTGLVSDDWPNGVRTLRPDTEWENMYRTVDLRLAREIPIGVGQVSVSAEIFNLFNWTNFAGRFGTMRDRSGNPLANFGEPNGVYAPRQAQLGLRYQF